VTSAGIGRDGGFTMSCMKTALAALGVASMAAIAACASTTSPPDATAAATAEARVLVKLVRPSSDGAAIARAASAAAGVPARYLASAGTQWHALALRCGSADGCDAAMQRLRSDAATFEAVQRDELKRPSVP